MSGLRPFSLWVVADDHPIATVLAKTRVGTFRIGAPSIETATLLGMQSADDGDARGVFARVSRAAADAIGVPTREAVGQRRRCTPRGTAARRAVVFVLREAGWPWRLISTCVGCDRTTAMGCHKVAAKLLARPRVGPPPTCPLEFAAAVTAARRALKSVDGVAAD